MRTDPYAEWLTLLPINDLMIWRLMSLIPYHNNMIMGIVIIMDYSLYDMIEFTDIRFKGSFVIDVM